MLKLVPYRDRRVEKSFDDMFHMMDNFFKMPTQAFKIDIHESDEKYTIEAEIPGIVKDQVKLEFEQDLMMIRIEKEESDIEEDRNYIRRERQSLTSERVLRFKNVDFENVIAKLEHGILTIEVNKKKEENSRKSIEIQ
jgi:HSP20 family protein